LVPARQRTRLKVLKEWSVEVLLPFRAMCGRKGRVGEKSRKEFGGPVRNSPLGEAGGL
jgi:hypothetical protein